ncbi:MAG: undecaprenyl-diphosphate phosphatase [Alphaproteobacteria bacterium]|nr:undecaprenyl-diphosphate phosphatase [Alphaproteobacteria bacterium]MCY4607170.1 undecaprenyl-diphosphate phosphatase [bacterium]
MTWLQLTVLALVQGITEFLPVSSSGHLFLASNVLGWPDQGLKIDIAVHGGTLLAVIMYFRKEIVRLLRCREAADRRLLVLIVAATVPVGGAGFVLHATGTDMLRDPALIAWTTLGFGLLLLAADRLGGTARPLEDLTWRSAVVIGLFQVAALVPGTSRAGVTITAARFLGYRRADCATFSMLLSIPVIGAAVLLAAGDMAASGDMALTRSSLVAAVLSFGAALITIRLFMAWLARASFTPFVIYRVLLAALLLAWLYL